MTAIASKLTVQIMFLSPLTGGLRTEFYEEGGGSCDGRTWKVPGVSLNTCAFFTF